MDDYLAHYGVLGMKWGVRRYQNEDGTLTPAGKRHLERADSRWLKKQDKTTAKKIQKKVERSSELKKYDKNLRKEMSPTNKDGSLSKNYAAAYNMKLAELMNQKASSLENYSPSGMVLTFVAKRGEIGVHTAMATEGYDLSSVRRGINAEGKVAYKKQVVDRI